MSILRRTLTPRQYRQVAEIALVFLTLIVFTGAAVRLSGSGLGCPDWPKCYGKVAPPLETHAWIEFGNRMLSGLVGLAAVAAGLLAFRRRPYRRDLALIGVLLPLGVVAQAVLGGFTVRNHLAPGFVMGHFGLSMLILIAAAALAWRARYEPGERPRTADRTAVWAVRGLLPLGALTIVAGTAATAAGPHAGGAGTGDEIDRLEWRGADTLDWAIHQHGRIATVLGVAAVAVWLLLRRRDADAQARRAMTTTCVLLGVQGAVGGIQYALELPAEIVWVHVALAACTWLALLWAAMAVGRPASARVAAPAERVGSTRVPVSTP
jgi:cytochrome c oxidase assembly protein subunit 15